MKNCITPLIRPLSLVGLALILVSCGTQKNVGYADGIYNETIETIPQEEDAQVSNNLNNEYYKNYFGETVEEVEDINNDAEVFTDVDDYNSNYQNDTSEPDNFTGNGGWGDTSDSVTINFIDNGWNNWGWGPGWGFGWGAGWGFGWNNWWGPGWGWGAGWGGWYGPGWGWGGRWYGPGWGYPGWGGGWYAGGYGYSYVNSRRGYNSYGNIGRSSLNGRSNTLAGRRVALGSTDRRGRSVTRLSQSRLNTDMRRSNRTTVATNSRSVRSSGYSRDAIRTVNGRDSQTIRNSGVNRSNTSRATRSSSSRNRTGTINSRNSNSRSSATRSSSRSSRSRGYNTTRSTRSNSSMSRSSRSRSSSSMSRSGGSRSSGSMSRGGGGSRSSGGGRSGGRGRG